MPKALWNDKSLAEASEDEVAMIEGNVYFPPSSVKEGILQESDTEYVCPWKGAAQYFDVVVNGETYPDGAWSYPDPMQSANERVGKEFGKFVAFSPEVDVKE